jgi:hypothetical protein
VAVTGGEAVTLLPLDVADDRETGAWISADGLYRYRLWRIWDGSIPQMVFVMLNPSTADATTDDPTIRRCIGFAKRENCGGIEVVNLYALRATKPVHLLDHPDPEGPGNCMAWAEALYDRPQPVVVAAWGANSDLAGLPESKALRGASQTWHCLGTTKDGAPRHPLYLKGNTPLQRWT